MDAGSGLAGVVKATVEFQSATEGSVRRTEYRGNFTMGLFQMDCLRFTNATTPAVFGLTTYSLEPRAITIATVT
jgi:hypothetical protein